MTTTAWMMTILKKSQFEGLNTINLFGIKFIVPFFDTDTNNFSVLVEEEDEEKEEYLNTFFSSNDVDDDHVEMSNVSPAFAGDGLFSPKASITTKKEEEVEDETSIPNRVGEEDKIDEIEQIHI